MKPSIIRLGILLLLFDVYLTWARMEKQVMPGINPGGSNLGTLAQQPIVLQYLFFCKVSHLIRALLLLTSCHSGALRIFNPRLPQ